MGEKAKRQKGEKAKRRKGEKAKYKILLFSLSAPDHYTARTFGTIT